MTVKPDVHEFHWLDLAYRSFSYMASDNSYHIAPDHAGLLQYLGLADRPPAELPYVLGGTQPHQYRYAPGVDIPPGGE